MSDWLTVVVAASKLAGFGSSLITFQPPTAHRDVFSAACAAVSSSGAQAIGTSA